MARDKERQLNPAAAKLKQDKAQAKAKAVKERTKQRQEKLSRQNPERIQNQIDTLLAAKERGALPAHDARHLEQLEHNLKAVRKAKEATGDIGREVGSSKQLDHGRRLLRGGYGGRGDFQRPRRKNDYAVDAYNSDDSTSSSVADVPMPDGPAPITFFQTGIELPAHFTGLPSKPTSVVPTAEVITTYSSAPIMRDLQKEATVFLPAALQRQKQAAAAIQKIRKDAEQVGIFSKYSEKTVEAAPDV